MNINMMRAEFSEKLRKNLKNKWVLLDTNILISSSQNPEAFSSIFTLFKEVNCRPVFCQLVRAEYLQSVWQKELIEEREQFLKDLDIEDITLRPMDQLTDSVMAFTRKLRARREPLPDLVDSYLIALAKKYSPNLLILTANHKDFAYSLERLYVHPIELSKQKVITVGLYINR